MSMVRALSRSNLIAARLLSSVGLGLLVLAAQPVQADTPQRGGTLTVAVEIEPASLDPAYSNASTDRSIYDLFAENLLNQDASGKFQPALAESWDYAPDHKSIVFHLRKGVKFQDGTDFDAQSVKFNLDRVTDPKLNVPVRHFLADLDSVDVVDPGTVRINLKEPSGAFLSSLALYAGSILSPTAIKSEGKDFARKPVGTGPFKVDSWTGGRIDVEKFDGYWRDGADGKKLPYLDHVVIRVILDSAVKIVELKTGNVQVGDSIQVKDYGQVAQDPDLQLVETIPGIQEFMPFNVTRAPFNNEDLRRAVTLAIDRQTLARVIAHGQGILTPAIEPPTSLAYDASIKGHSFDIAAAKEAYQKSGYTGVLTLSVIQRDPDTQIAQILQAMLRQAGINLQIEVLERQAWFDKVLGKTYQFGIVRTLTPRNDPDLTFSDFYGKNARQNYSGFQNGRIDEIISTARRETDPDKRRKYYAEIQQIVLDNFAESYLFFTPNKYIIRREVQDLRQEFSGGWQYADTWLKH